MKKTTAFNDLVAVSEYWAEKTPDKTAFIYLVNGEGKETKISYLQLRQKALRIATVLREVVEPGQTAILLYSSSLEFICAFWGCLYAGVIAVPVNPPVSKKSRLTRLINIVKDCRAELMLSTAEMITSIRKFETDIKIDLRLDIIATDTIPETSFCFEAIKAINDVAFLQYTSGSTSSPKGVMVTHRNLLHNQQMIKKGFGHSQATIFAGWLPLFHDMGLIGNVIQPFYLGILSVLMSPVAFIQKPVRWLKAISKYGATTSGGPNFAFDHCVQRIADVELTDINLSTWKVAFNGAEPIRAEVIERFTRRFSSCGFKPEAFYPCYGLAEATLFVSGASVSQPPYIKSFCATALKKNRVDGNPAANTAVRLVSSGKEWGGQSIRIVNPETLTPCGEKDVGEIWISGDSVAAGYWQNAEATRKTFKAIISGESEKIHYLRTGDLGFLLKNQLFITGRLKELMIIRGANYYPQDIESSAQKAASPYLRRNSGAAFVMNTDTDQALCLVNEIERAYLPKLDKQEIARKIQQHVFAEHGLMIKHIAFLKPLSLPKTSSGKIQRLLAAELFSQGKLKEIGRIDSYNNADEIYSRDDGDPELINHDIHHRVRNILGNILEKPVDQVSSRVPIYALGIDSVKAIQLHMLLEQTFSCILRLDDVLAGPSLDGLAVLVSQAPSREAPVSVPTGSATPSPAIYRLSHNQKSLWFEYQLSPQSAAYNLFFAVKPFAPLDDEAMFRAVSQLMQRHQILRTIYHPNLDSDDGVAQHVQPCPTAPFFIFDVHRQTPADIRRLVTESAYKPFNLESCVWAVELYQGGSCGQVLLFKIHHIAADLGSMQILVQELFDLYTAQLAGKSVVEETTPYRYADFTCWQTDYLKRQEIHTAIDYWQRIYSDMHPILELPYDRSVSDATSGEGAAVALSLPEEVFLKVNDLASQLNVSLNALLLSAYALLLQKYTSQNDICIGVPFSGRTRLEFNDIVGCFVNMSVLRIKMQSEQTFINLAEKVKTALARAARWQDIPYRLVVEKMLEGDRREHRILYSTQFLFQKLHRLSAASSLLSYSNVGKPVTLADLELGPYEIPIRSVQTDLDVVVIPEDRSLHVRWIYNRHKFDPETITRLGENYFRLLEKIILTPHKRLSAISCLSDQERLLMDLWNDTRVPFDESCCIHHLFEAQVHRTPSDDAIRCKGQRMSYTQLNAMADKIADFLIRKQIAVEDAVAICMERDIRSVAAILGILKSGATYVPIDPRYPRQRRHYIINDAKVRMLLADTSTKSLFNDAGVNTLTIEEILRTDDKGRLAPVQVSGANRSHIIYTSGSTGRPKGVQIEHKSVAALIAWAHNVYSSEEIRYVLAGTSFCFDLSVFEMFVPLSMGGCVELVDNILTLVSCPEKVTLINTVPSAAQSLLEQGLLPESVTTVNLAGEPLKQSLVDKLYALPKIKKVYDLYGPSEDTTYSTVALRQTGGDETIGRPITNTAVYLVDERDERVPIGAKGQIVLSGHGLSRGYLNRPELTEAAFFVTDRITGKQERFYRTGDLAKYDRGGNLRLLGRLDNQIKLRGYRIELGEVESALLKMPQVRECVVVKCSMGNSDCLLCYYAGYEDEDIMIGNFQSFLKEFLPDFMIPSFYNRMKRLPRNANGKIDRKSLPEPDLSRRNTIAEPTTDVERKILSIYSDLLDTRQIGIHNNFFELGGHSLLAVKLLSKLRQALDVTLPLQVFLANPTVSELAGIIDKNSDIKNNSALMEEIRI